jgi:hypothetical protein
MFPLRLKWATRPTRWAQEWGRSAAQQVRITLPWPAPASLRNIYPAVAAVRRACAYGEACAPLSRSAGVSRRQAMHNAVMALSRVPGPPATESLRAVLRWHLPRLSLPVQPDGHVGGRPWLRRRAADCNDTQLALGGRGGAPGHGRTSTPHASSTSPRALASAAPRAAATTPAATTAWRWSPYGRRSTCVRTRAPATRGACVGPGAPLRTRARASCTAAAPSKTLAEIGLSGAPPRRRAPTAR